MFEIQRGIGGCAFRFVTDNGNDSKTSVLEGLMAAPAPVINPYPVIKPSRYTQIILTLLVLLAILGGVFHYWINPCLSAPKLTTPYQAVLLNNGSVYFGKLSQAGSEYPVLTDVYYLQSVTNKDTNQASNVLVKRGKEWHGPDHMILNARNIVLIEPVGENSKVAQLIAESRR